MQIAIDRSSPSISRSAHRTSRARAAAPPRAQTRALPQARPPAEPARATLERAFGPDLFAATGIPSPVRAKMEAAFGADFSGVRVHPRSSRAVELGALAYTQGSEIHVAPGQWAPETRQGQELLGHELAHVVQQREGRVQATAQYKGVALNADSRLEAEADAMGRRAASAPADRSGTPLPARGLTTSSGGPVQRLVVWHAQARTSSFVHVNAFANGVDKVVQEGAKLALEDPMSMADSDNHVKRWKVTAQILIDENAGTRNANAAVVQKANREMYMHYGYAVESHTSTEVNDLCTTHLPKGYTCPLQVTYGSTRPDIVVRDDHGQDEAWFDLTSDASAGHIWGKQSSKWKSMSNVAEITYPALDKASVGTGTMSPGAARAMKAKIAGARRKRERELDDVRQEFIDTWEEDEPSTKRGRQDRAREIIADLLGEDVTPTEAKDVLRAIDLDPLDYGWAGGYGKKVGGSKAEGLDLLKRQNFLT